MKNIIYSFIILASIVGMVGCQDINYIDNKYYVGGEDFLVAKLDSFKYYGGNQRAKLVVWCGDFRSTKLVVSRADSNFVYGSFGLSETDRKDSMVFIINSLKEGTNVLAMQNWNADSTVHSIPMGFTVTTWGPKYMSFLPSRSIVSSKFNLLTKAFTITWSTSNAIEPSFGRYAIGHEIQYTNSSGVVKLIRDIYPTLTIATPTVTTPLPNYPTTGGSYSYRMLYMPTATCIDTFRTAYKTITTP